MVWDVFGKFPRFGGVMDREKIYLRCRQTNQKSRLCFEKESSRIQRFNILKDNWGRWKQDSRTLIGSFMARRKPCVLTLGRS
ncbi:hypothetical protein TNCV_1337611 [Trichonephila clavipes]|nr:hypothetical protein TNCV_1337611 [Trichonephila clavipes]